MKTYYLTIWYTQSKHPIYWQTVKRYMGKGEFLGVGADQSGSYIAFGFPTERTAENAKKRLEKSDIEGIVDIDIES